MKRKLVGQGTYADVFKFSEDSVIKIPTRDYNFINEICVMNSLNHPNLARARDAVIQDGRIAIVSNLAISDLAQYMQKRELSVSNKLSISGQICHAVRYLHKSGWLHLDLKVSNVLVFPGLQVKITDFGFSLPTDPRGQRRVSHPVFSPITLPPENERSGGLFGYYSDMWSLGVMIAEIYSNGKLRHMVRDFRKSRKAVDKFLAGHRKEPRVLRRLIRETLTGYRNRISAAECCEILKIDSEMSWSSGMADAWPLPHSGWSDNPELYKTLYTAALDYSKKFQLSIEALLLVFNLAIRIDPTDYPIETLVQHCVYISSVAVDRGSSDIKIGSDSEIQLGILRTLNFVSYQPSILPECGCNKAYRLIAESLSSVDKFVAAIQKLPEHRCQGKGIDVYTPIKSVIRD